jgi:hypothetical protein
MYFINEVIAGPLDKAPKLNSYLVSAIQFLTTLIGVIAVLAIVIAGIMYMTSGGDVGRVQFAKKALWSGIIGLVVAISALLITKLIVGFTG